MTIGIITRRQYFRVCITYLLIRYLYLKASFTCQIVIQQNDVFFLNLLSVDKCWKQIFNHAHHTNYKYKSLCVWMFIHQSCWNYWTDFDVWYTDRVWANLGDKILFITCKTFYILYFVPRWQHFALWHCNNDLIEGVSYRMVLELDRGEWKKYITGRKNNASAHATHKYPLWLETSRAFLRYFTWVTRHFKLIYKD